MTSGFSGIWAAPRSARRLSASSSRLTLVMPRSRFLPRSSIFVDRSRSVARARFARAHVLVAGGSRGSTGGALSRSWSTIASSKTSVFSHWRRESTTWRSTSRSSHRRASPQVSGFVATRRASSLRRRWLRTTSASSASRANCCAARLNNSRQGRDVAASSSWVSFGALRPPPGRCAQFSAARCSRRDAVGSSTRLHLSHAP
mmetsp:Transcript_16378/g.56490  ORF Transcript_16378/g.56490 Transcript_16378/m.56490 type:complete len:202 (-) Transcript_16378:125-730(-)